MTRRYTNMFKVFFAFLSSFKSNFIKKIIIIGFFFRITSCYLLENGVKTHLPIQKAIENDPYSFIRIYTKNNSSRVIRCPEYFRFHPAKLKCVFDEEGDQERREGGSCDRYPPFSLSLEAALNFNCSRKPDGKFPDAESCRNFFACQSQRTYWTFCDSINLFNEKTKNCEPPTANTFCCEYPETTNEEEDASNNNAIKQRLKNTFVILFSMLLIYFS